MKGEKKIIGAKVVKIEKFDDYIFVYLDNGMAVEVSHILPIKEVESWEKDKAFFGRTEQKEDF